MTSAVDDVPHHLRFEHRSGLAAFASPVKIERKHDDEFERR